MHTLQYLTPEKAARWPTNGQVVYTIGMHGQMAGIRVLGRAEKDGIRIHNTAQNGRGFKILHIAYFWNFSCNGFSLHCTTGNKRQGRKPRWKGDCYIYTSQIANSTPRWAA